ncbi:hypothetical protein [Flagellimonas hadalis]|uniref:Uncharacterized protein n=1 Tax=Flagellimonas hadalis TaxID=2597517 RepID=A0A5N5IT89_9FLAO|nr:hypothetical protein [Allomuricauda hadalis]KAB5488772.1 hypothetical protein FOT42_009160 [Allomuricauda hadalis]
MKKYSIIGICMFIILACSNDDDTKSVDFHYASENFEVAFRSQGTIPQPSIEWPQENGTFSLKEPIEGLTIDENTGALSIERSLQVGEHEVTVIAQSGSQNWETRFLLTSILKYTFWVGGRNNDPDSEEVEYNSILQLYEDGTLDIELIDEVGSEGVGVWSIDGNAIQMWLCTYCSDMNPQDVPQTDEHSYFEGTLDNDMPTAEISGTWFVVRFDPDSTTLRGNFVFEWD